MAGGMSGSPVYIDGKLVGAVSLRLSVFSPDAICGITPIGLMLEVNEFDKTRPANRRTPGDLLNKAAAEAEPAATGGLLPESATMTPIATPITMSGFTEQAMQAFSPVFQQLGMTVMQGGSLVVRRPAEVHSMQQSPPRAGNRRCNPAIAWRRCWFPAT